MKMNMNLIDIILSKRINTKKCTFNGVVHIVIKKRIKYLRY